MKVNSDGGGKSLCERYDVGRLSRNDVEWDQIGTASKPIWLLFDSARHTFWDVELWSFFKNPIPNVYVVFFSIFGAVECGQETDGVIRNAPIYIPPTRRIGLHPTSPNGPCLSFSFKDYKDYVLTRSRFSQDYPNLDGDLQQWMHQASGGHIGAINALFGWAMDVSVR